MRRGGVVRGMTVKTLPGRCFWAWPHVPGSACRVPVGERPRLQRVVAFRSCGVLRGPLPDATAPVSPSPVTAAPGGPSRERPRPGPARCGTCGSRTARYRPRRDVATAAGRERRGPLARRSRPPGRPRSSPSSETLTAPSTRFSGWTEPYAASGSRPAWADSIRTVGRWFSSAARRAGLVSAHVPGGAGAPGPNRLRLILELVADPGR